MANLSNNQFHNLRLEINNEEYWDFFLNKDANISDIDSSLLGDTFIDKCISAAIDIRNKECVNGNELISLPEYKWEYSNAVEHTLYNVGYTGLDNGLIQFRRDTIDNKKFFDIYQTSTYRIDDDKLRLHQVTGGTRLYEYPVTVEDDKIKLNGGFYQGFFKTDCKRYQVLPSTLHNGETWQWEFVLQPQDFEKESDKTLNDKYPENKGIFFYIGTRAENKWDYLYNPDKDTDCSISYFEDYGDDTKIDKQTHIINSFLDMSITDDMREWEEFAVDDYLSFKYYDNSAYTDNTVHGMEDFFYETHKAETIDEDKLPYQEITCWCKGNECVETKKIKKRAYFCCCPARCKSIETEGTIEVKTECNSYLSHCEPFDLVDIDEDDFGEGCGVDYIEDDIDISDFDYKTVDGFELKINGQWFLDTDNKFLMFDRTCNGYTVHNFKEGDIVRYIGVRNKFKGNLFLLMNRTCTGYTVNNINGVEESYKEEYNVEKDLYNNAFALRITDDGRIGYRYLVQDCGSDNRYKILENYSKAGIIKKDTWNYINVGVDGYRNTMALRFYVNGKLVFLTNEMPKFNFKKLNDLDEKQETVPFNISLGGGTQGLCETILPNYMLDPYRVYPLEKNFAGTFIGYLQVFNFRTCKMDFFDALNNYRFEIRHLQTIY